VAALRAEADAEVRALWEEFTLLRKAGAGLQEADRSASPALPETALAAYAGGVFLAVEFLDACRAHLDESLLRTDLALAARKAKIQLEEACGGMSL